MFWAGREMKEKQGRKARPREGTGHQHLNSWQLTNLPFGIHYYMSFSPAELEFTLLLSIYYTTQVLNAFTYFISFIKHLKNLNIKIPEDPFLSFMNTLLY